MGSIAEDGVNGEPHELDVRLAEHVSEVFRRTARSSDAIGRLGRGEFAIIAPAMDQGGALRFVERLQHELESTPAVVDGVARHLKVRAGYCAVSDFAQSSFDAVELLLRAASALRQARGAEAVDGSKTHDLLAVPFIP
ncbi:MAG TPA: diguanylate cyclase [Gemmatimonadaceae bacterium]|nr:diguanylate cyclase [Gemmatimonadaceae bacterium]